MIEIIYAGQVWEGHGASVFFAGPSLGEKHHYNWCPVAVRLLREYGFQGTIFLPLPDRAAQDIDERKHTTWELEYMHRTRAIAVWVPAAYECMRVSSAPAAQALQTHRNKVVAGHPISPLHIRSPYYLLGMKSVPVEPTMQAMLQRAMHVATAPHEQQATD